MPAEKKVIAVVGATGPQGISVTRAILNDSEFSVRAITRNATSEKAQLLRQMGVEVVQADIGDEASLTKATEGCYGMYCLSFYWRHKNPELERRYVDNMAFVAKNVGIQHVIWSTLEDTRHSLIQAPTLMRDFKVPFFDAKADCDHSFMEAGVPTTYLMAPFYWDNFIHHLGMGPKKGPDGKLSIRLPMGKKHLVGIAIDDIGKCALGIFKRPSEYINHRVGICSEPLTMAEIAEKMSRALNKEVVYKAISLDEYRDQKIADVEEFANMFLYYHDCEQHFLNTRSVAEARKLNPELMTFDQWLDKYQDHLLTEE